jgi:hypothetical protein
VRAYVGERADGTSQVWHIELEDVGAAQALGRVLGVRSIADDLLDGERGRRLVTMRMPWSTADGAETLARSVLRRELAVEPAQPVTDRFIADVISGLPDDLFVLTAEQVWRWVVERRTLIDHEQFLSSVDDEPALAAVDGDEATASAVVAACERAWHSIQSHHPEVPDAVIVLGSGVERGRLVKLGHWWGGRWLADGQVRGEVLIAGEALHLEPAQVFEVLLHEAAHGINASRGVKDTSRGGRYHNQRYAATAREVLLRVRSMPPYGMAETLLTPAASERYGEVIADLGDAMRIARQLERAVTRGDEGGVAGDDSGRDRERASGRSSAASCGCGRRVRVAPSTLAAGPIVCGLCGSAFAEAKQAEQAPAAAVVDRSFLARRQQQLDVEPGAPDEVDRLALHHERLQAIVDELGPTAPPVTSLLQERLHRLEALRGAPVRAPAATTDQRGGLADLARELLADADADPVRHWYERVGTSAEEPMPVSGDREAERRIRLARALLRADGTVRGPEAMIGDLPVAAGDRVIVASPNSMVPTGTLGTVTRVDADAAFVEVDFPTWGSLRVGPDDPLRESLRHDYVAPREPLAPEIELDRYLPEPSL